MRVNEIFYSIEGEGVRAGMPCTFIRLFGCNLICSYCDTRYACEGDDYKEMTPSEIMKAVSDYGCPNVTLTGGEPLIHKDVDILLRLLLDEGYKVNVETNGSVVPRIKGPIYTVDYKTLSSGVSDKMNVEAFKVLTANDVVKFVVGSLEDLEQALEFVRVNDIKAQVFISPIFGKIELVDIAQFITSRGLYNWRMQIQLHKYIWDPNKRGV